MKAEEIRKKLISELEAQFSNNAVNSATQNTQDDSLIGFNSTILDKPKMFMPKSLDKKISISNEVPLNTVKGIGFAENSKQTLSNFENCEIYNMKELIDTNPENMQTFTYDEKVIKAQLALVKKREWQDILFEDVDWFKKIDVIGGLKRTFHII